MEERQEARRALSDAVALWRLRPEGAASDVIDAATQALVDGLDSPTLRELAGASSKESWFVLSPMVERTVDELGIPDLLATAPERAALEVMVRRFQAGSLSARELGGWAHHHIGHDGDPECQPFVELDDMYDVADYVDDTEEQINGWVAEEADAFLTGRPSPGRADRRAALPSPSSPAPPTLRNRIWDVLHRTR